MEKLGRGGGLGCKGKRHGGIWSCEGNKASSEKAKDEEQKEFSWFLSLTEKKKKPKRKLFIVTEPSLKIYGARLGTEIMKDSVASRYRTAVSQILRTLKICLCFMVIFSPAPALSPDGIHSLFFHRMEVLLF